MDLLISYSWGRFYPTRDEVVRILRRMGDEHPTVRSTHVDGIAVAHTALDNREVIRRCRDLLERAEEFFEFAVKWVPVDYWCNTDLDAMKQVIEKQACARIQPDESWAMRAHKRRWQTYHTADIVEHLAAGIDHKVDLKYPDKILWVDVLGRRTAISVLESSDIFSMAVS